MAALLDYIFTDDVSFPHPLHYGGNDQPIAIGGDLSSQRLLMAYGFGVFPWFDEQPVLWWFTQPRFVLYTEQLKTSKSLRQVMKKSPWSITFNQSFSAVIENCAHARRTGQYGTWINEDMITAYTELHHQGWAHSVEVWDENLLIGGLYGVLIGNIFFGESMFSLESNASKVGFAIMVKLLRNKGVHLIDCQQETRHLKSFGAKLISGLEFQEELSLNRRLTKGCIFPKAPIQLPYTV